MKNSDKEKNGQLCINNSKSEFKSEFLTFKSTNEFDFFKFSKQVSNSGFRADFRFLLVY